MPEEQRVYLGVAAIVASQTMRQMMDPVARAIHHHSLWMRASWPPPTRIWKPFIRRAVIGREPPICWAFGGARCAGN
jgi:hypothetical protein